MFVKFHALMALSRYFIALALCLGHFEPVYCLELNRGSGNEPGEKAASLKQSSILRPDRFEKLEEILLDSLLIDIDQQGACDSKDISSLKSLVNSTKQVLSDDDELLLYLGYKQAHCLARSKKMAGARRLLKRVLKANLKADSKTESRWRQTIHKSEFKNGVESKKVFLKRFQTQRKLVESSLSEAICYRMERFVFNKRYREANLLAQIACLIYADNVDDQIVFWNYIATVSLAPHKALEPVPQFKAKTLSIIASAFLLSKQKKDKEAISLLEELKLDGDDCDLSSSGIKDYASFLKVRVDIDKGLNNRSIAEAQSFIDAKKERRRGYSDSFIARALMMDSLSNLSASAQVEFNRLIDLVDSSNCSNNPANTLANTQTEVYRTSIDRAIDSVYKRDNVTLTEESKLLELSDSIKDRWKRLAELYYYIGYKYKTGGRQELAQANLIKSIYINSNCLKDKSSFLDGYLYDLAESYFWDKKFDLGVVVFRQCLDLRKEQDRDPGLLIMTMTALGRCLMSDGKPQKATDVLRQAVDYSLLNILLDKSIQEAAKAKGIEYGFILSPNKLTNLKELETMPLDKLLSVIDKTYQLAPESKRGVLQDAVQVWTDSYVGYKYYDQARKIATALLSLKVKINPEADISSNIWQLAFISSGAQDMASSRRYYDRLFKSYSGQSDRSKAHWYYCRGLANDSTGKFKDAASDFKRAAKLFGRHLKEIEADIGDDYDIDLDKYVDRDYILWSKLDLLNELSVRRKDPPTRACYLKAYKHAYWPITKQPLKVFIDRSRSCGFGARLYESVESGIKQWTEVKQAPLQFVFVQDKKKADIYVERVDNYDFIPPGSAGRAEAEFLFLPDSKGESRQLNKVHLRIFSDTYDGDKLSKHAIRHIKTLAAHEFGHALGLNHSPNGQDIMYWKADTTELSRRDCKTLIELYRQQK